MIYGIIVSLMYMFNTDIFKENLKEFYSYILNVIVIIGKTIF